MQTDATTSQAAFRVSPWCRATTPNEIVPNATTASHSSLRVIELICGLLEDLPSVSSRRMQNQPSLRVTSTRKRGSSARNEQDGMKPCLRSARGNRRLKACVGHALEL